MPEVNIDKDGYINTEWYITAAMDIIERGAEERGRDINKIDANEMTPLWRAVYNTLFKPDKEQKRPHNEKCNVDYNTENLSRLIDIYTALAGIYNVLPSFEALELMTGIFRTVFEQYVTGAGLIITKCRKTWVQNGLSKFPIGMVTLANNDIDTGLCYNRQNITDRATVSKALNFSDLVRIGENVTQKDNVSRLETAQTQDIVD